jgi:hypothetical protein
MVINVPVEIFGRYHESTRMEAVPRKNRLMNSGSIRDFSENVQPSAGRKLRQSIRLPFVVRTSAERAR